MINMNDIIWEALLYDPLEMYLLRRTIQKIKLMQKFKNRYAQTIKIVRKTKLIIIRQIRKCQARIQIISSAQHPCIYENIREREVGLQAERQLEPRPEPQLQPEIVVPLSFDVVANIPRCLSDQHKYFHTCPSSP